METLRVPIGNDLINFLFLGCLLLLIISRLILIPRDEPIFRLKPVIAESENFTLYVTISSFIYIVLLSLVLLPYFNITIPFYNYDLPKLTFLFLILLLYQIISYILGNIFFIILGKNEEHKKNYANRFIFLFIKLIFCILLCILNYYTNISKEYIPNITIITISIIIISEWIWLMFFMKKKIMLPGYYEFLYLCTFEILPALCIIKLVFL